MSKAAAPPLESTFWLSASTALLLCTGLTAAVFFGPVCPIDKPAGLSVAALCFQPSLVGIGPSEYGERYDPTSFLKMPFNAAVNAGYLIVAVYWLRKAHALACHSSHRYLLSVFALFSALYAPIQFGTDLLRSAIFRCDFSHLFLSLSGRIVTQDWRMGVLDQIITPPFFIWASFMSYCATRPYTLPLPTVVVKGALLLLLSSLSYAAALLWPAVGFDASLVVHMLLTVGCFTNALVTAAPQVRSRLRQPFTYAILCSAGFVGLKLLDFWLASQHPFFTVLSGHFWSKICDFLQVCSGKLSLERTISDRVVVFDLQVHFASECVVHFIRASRDLKD
jgi:hypothetical protein